MRSYQTSSQASGVLQESQADGEGWPEGDNSGPSAQKPT